jgi:hypothetical protein
VGQTSRSVRMGLRPTNSDENQIGGRAILPAVGFLAGSGRLERRLRPRLAALQFEWLTVGFRPCASATDAVLIPHGVKRRVWRPAAGVDARPTSRFTPS